MLVGLGARNDRDVAAVRALSASRNVPVMVTYKAKGVLPDDDSRFAGVFTNGELEREIVDRSDLLLTVGLDHVELLPRPWTYAQPIVDIAGDDIAAALGAIGAELKPSMWDVPALRRTVDAQRRRVQPSSDQLAAHDVISIANAAFPEARVTVDAGAHMFPATLLWRVAAPRQMLISNGLSTMGFALPAAIGAALHARSAGGSAAAEHVVAITGDGGLLMCAGELLTAVRERLPIVIIVLSDGSLSLIDVKQRQRRLRPAGVALGDISWASLAESFRMKSVVATTDQELDDALAAARTHRGPTLVDVRIDPATYEATLRAVRG